MTNPETASRSRRRRLLVGSFNLAAALLLATLFSAVLFLVALFTLFRARRFYSEFWARHFSRLMLFLGRTPWRVFGEIPAGPTFYMPNHPSTQDIFVWVALGLPNTRFFMSRSVLRRFPPIGLAAALIGTFFLPEQHDTPGRVRRFERAWRHLARSGESILGTPEGRIVPDPEVGRFNRGVFHLATLLQYPIQPLFMVFPTGGGGGRGFTAAPEVEVFFLPPIATAGWRVDEVDRRKEEVRAVFVRFAERAAAIGGEAAWAETLTRAQTPAAGGGGG